MSNHDSRQCEASTSILRFRDAGRFALLAVVEALGKSASRFNGKQWHTFLELANDAMRCGIHLSTAPAAPPACSCKARKKAPVFPKHIISVFVGR